MAQEVHCDSREAFIKKLSLKFFQVKLFLLETSLLNEIDSLKEKILAQGEKELDWDGYEDEDCLGLFEKFHPGLNLFDRANKLFDKSDYEMARSLLRELRNSKNEGNLMSLDG